ncbi:MAG: hypothetical protein H7210_13365 [Pyrinomonadaceae bacterium]|nr:hypothetical protein [Phycisphaerales bacterium]
MDTILLKALEKDPSRRYQSPAALAEDIRRSLSNQPILARPQTARYQLRKLVARHKITSFLIIAICLLVVAGAVWMSVLYTQANSLRAKAEDEAIKTRLALQAEAAQSELAKKNERASRRVTSVLIEAFRQTDPTLHLTRNVAAKEFFAREILRVGAARVISDLSEEPSLQASLLQAFGEIYVNIGVFDHGQELLERCVDVRRKLGESRELAYANVLMELAVCVHLNGDTHRAATLAEEAVEIYTDKLRSDDPILSRTVSQLGLFYLTIEELDKAMRAFERAGVTGHSIPGHDSGFQAARLSGIAGVLFAKGQTLEAEAVLRKGIELSLADYRPDAIIVCSLRNNLAWVLYHRGEFEDGIHQATLALEGRRVTFSGAHVKISDSLLVLGVLTAESGEPLKGELLLREALRIRTTAVPDAKALIGESQAALAACLGFLRRFDEGDTLMTSGVASLRESYGDQHTDTQLAIRQAVGFYESWGKLERAREYRSLMKPPTTR